jgi:hypothetical protein
VTFEPASLNGDPYLPMVEGAMSAVKKGVVFDRERRRLALLMARYREDTSDPETEPAVRERVRRDLIVELHDLRALSEEGTSIGRESNPLSPRVPSCTAL